MGCVCVGGGGGVGEGGDVDFQELASIFQRFVHTAETGFHVATLCLFNRVNCHLESLLLVEGFLEGMLDSKGCGNSKTHTHTHTLSLSLSLSLSSLSLSLSPPLSLSLSLSLSPHTHFFFTVTD